MEDFSEGNMSWVVLIYVLNAWTEDSLEDEVEDFEPEDNYEVSSAGSPGGDSSDSEEEYAKKSECFYQVTNRGGVISLVNTNFDIFVSLLSVWWDDQRDRRRLIKKHAPLLKSPPKKQRNRPPDPHLSPLPSTTRQRRSSIGRVRGGHHAIKKWQSTRMRWAIFRIGDMSLLSWFSDIVWSLN